MLYKDCVKCEKLGVSCDGPNFFTLPANEILEWCKARKAELHLSNDKIADLSRIPRGTVARVFAGEHEDFKFGTVQPILRVLIGGTYHRESCPDPKGNAAEKLADLAEKNESLRRVIKENKAAYDQDLERERSDAARREKYFENQMRVRMIFIIILSVLLAAALMVIIAALLVDRTNPGKGFFWLEDLFAPAAQCVSNRLLSLMNIV
jgi:hypothetical protein